MLPKIDPALIGTRLGAGCYACVYEYGADQALKLARDDGTRDYLEWCYVRGRRYGRGSPEMANLPWVHAVGPLSDLPELPDHIKEPSSGWYALMERYDCTLKVHKQWENTRWPEELWVMPELAAAVRLLRAELGDDATCDMHSSNVMWSAKRGELIITDPSSGSYSGSYRVHGQPYERADITAAHICRGWRPTKHRRAQWKLPPLQQQFHMRVQ